jgi:hypothetical protein
MGMIDPATPQVRRFAQQLLAEEATLGSGSGRNGPVVLRVCEKLRRPLMTLAGSAGFDAIDRDPHNHLAEAEVLLLAEKIGLLFIFIGQALTLRLINDIWPNASFVIEGGREKEA